MNRLSPGLLLLATLPAFAADQAPELAVRFPHLYVEYRLGDDGAAVETRDWAMTVLQQRAIEQAKQSSITYSTSIQHAEVLAAWTEKADGRRIDAPKSNFQLEANSGNDRNAPVFSDQTTLTVVFPEVEVGDTVHFNYRVSESEPMFPGQFSDMEIFSRSTAYDDVRVSLDAPAALWLQTQANQMQAQPAVEKDGRRILAWTYANPNPARDKRRDYSVFDIESAPGVLFSTFHDYAAIAQAYAARARPKALPDERVRRLAADIVGGRTDAREQAHALYDWVATNITYGGNCIGTGAVVPHDLSFVLDNKMGDCKDHATLLQALLAARGIEATQALVNAGSGYRLPKVPVVSYVNHVINYLPAFGIYADSTSQDTPFGLLPFADADKPVLLVDGKDTVGHTPASAAGRRHQDMKSVLTIAADGSVSGEVEIHLGGALAAAARAGMRGFPKDEEADLVEHMLQRRGYIGKGSFEHDDPKDLTDSYRYRISFQMQDYTQLPGPAGFVIAPVISSSAPLGEFASTAVADDVDYDTTCSGASSVEEYSYQLPANMKVLATPDDVELSNGFLHYRAHYHLAGRRLEVRREIDDRTPGNVCGPEISAAYKKFAKGMLRDLKAQ
ncbi:MAG TPA: DUF3857 and transglutaminase domain-containing protein, partial [Nevskiaceae bacterium]|nr:DUF3857 and transglutaminase domain-containing protein [Nevskiaceae bacterium]